MLAIVRSKLILTRSASFAEQGAGAAAPDGVWGVPTFPPSSCRRRWRLKKKLAHEVKLIPTIQNLIRLGHVLSGTIIISI